MAQVTIRTESCKSCGYCVKFCPKGVLAVGHRGQLQGLPLCGGRTPGKLHRLCHLRTYVSGRGHRSV